MVRRLLVTLLVAHVLWIPAHAQEEFRAVIDRAGDMAPLNSLVIMHQDSIVVEAYFRGMRRERRANIKSASKSVLSALIGMAIRDGTIDSLDQPLASLLPEYFDGAQTSKQEITVRNALTMRTGLETTSFSNYGSWVSSRDWVRYQVDQEVECAPGACWSYSTGTSHLLGAILAKQDGRSLLTYAREELFEPLGVFLPAWDRDPQGRYLGGNNMALRPIDMLRFGKLYLDDGQVGGRQLLDPDWIDASWSTYGRSPWNGNSYGFMWWSRRLAGETVYFAWGYGGQFVFVVPRLELVVATTASLTNRPRGVNHNSRVYDLVEEAIIPAIRTRRPTYGAPAR